MSEPDLLEPALEPVAVAALGTREDTVIYASIAISLKRIADAVAGTDDTQGMNLTLFYMEQRLGPQS